MLGELLRRGGQGQQLVGGQAVQRHRGHQARMAERERSGLVKQDRVNASGRLDRRPLLDQAPAERRVPDRRHQGRRRGEHHHAWTEDDQHRDRPQRVARQRPQRHREHDRRRCVQQRVAVQNTLDRRLLLLGLFDQAADLPQRRLLPDPARDDLKRSKAVQRPGEDLIPSALVDRDALAGDRRLLDRTHTRPDLPVDRDPFARTYQHDITHPDLSQRDQRLAVLAANGDHIRQQSLQAVQRAAGPRGYELLQQTPNQQQHRDHSRGGELANRNR